MARSPVVRGGTHAAPPCGARRSEIKFEILGGVALFLFVTHPGYSQTFTKNPTPGEPDPGGPVHRLLRGRVGRHEGRRQPRSVRQQQLPLSRERHRGLHPDHHRDRHGITPATGRSARPGPTTTTTATSTATSRARTSAPLPQQRQRRLHAVDDGDIGRRSATAAGPRPGRLRRDGDLDLAITHPAGFVPGVTDDEPPVPQQRPVRATAFTRVTTGPIVTGLDLLHRRDLVRLRRRRRPRLLHRRGPGQRNDPARLPLSQPPRRDRHAPTSSGSRTPRSPPTCRTARSGTGSTTTTTATSTPT